MSLILILALPFAGSLLAAVLPANARNTEAWLAGVVALACVFLTAMQFAAVSDGLAVYAYLNWAPTLGLNIVLRMDGYSWLFSMIISVMGVLVVLYARYYMSPEDPVRRFFSFFQAFMGAMLGVVLSGNLIQLVLFWELTSLSSFMLIAYWQHRADARRGARMALIVTAAGGLCLLAGVMLIGHIVGSYELDAVLACGSLIREHPWYLGVLVLVALGALTKSAQFPFHFWLPHAMAAPTPVSAYLHSATMVKAGVFLLARFWPVLSGTDEWFLIIGGAGLCALVIGAYAAIFQRDMKGVLAYSTISHLGLITLLLGMNSTLGLVAAIFHMVNHATFKASLFMAAGIVDHETGTRDLTRLSGLRHAMPITTTLAIVAAAAMAGVPLLNGFISKEMFFTETVYLTGNSWGRIGLPIAATVAGAFSVAYSLRFIVQVFYGKPAQDLPRAPHEPPKFMLVPSAILATVCLLVGVLPSYTLGPLLDVAAGSILGKAMPQYSLALWHGFSLPLVMSMLALIVGTVLYLALRRQQEVHPGRAPIMYRLDGRHSFEWLLQALETGGAWLVAHLSSYRLQWQLLVMIAVALAAAALPLSQGGWGGRWQALSPIDPVFLGLWVVGGACTLGVAFQAKYHRLAALTLAGGTGLIVCLTFMWFSAPDLALTQMAVEVVTVVLLLLGLRWLPRRIEFDDEGTQARRCIRGRRLRDLALAIMVGAGLAALAFAVLTRPLDNSISSFFLEQALPLGHGTNVVNVLLVDFRSFDTLGEIAVVGVVALTVYALLRRFRPAKESFEQPIQQQRQDADYFPTGSEVLLPRGNMMVPTVLVRLILPMTGLISVFFLLRGHNYPGGGFVGGLVLATGVIVQYMMGGVMWVESRSRLHPLSWIAIGLLLAGGAAISAWFGGRPFLTALHIEPMVPLVGKIYLSTVLLFDIGVYMLVIGATVLILVALAHQSLRVQRKLAAITETAAETAGEYKQEGGGAWS